MKCKFGETVVKMDNLLVFTLHSNRGLTGQMKYIGKRKSRAQYFLFGVSNIYGSVNKQT